MKRPSDFDLEGESTKKIDFEEKKTTFSSHFSSSKGDTDKLDEKTELWITIIDVGQGESTLIRYRSNIGKEWKDEHVVLVDGGRAHFAKLTIAPTLEALGVKRIDTIICSHYDADHMEGLTELPGVGESAKVYERSLVVRGEDDKVAKFRKAHKTREILKKGNVIPLGKDKLCPSLKCVCVNNSGTLWSDENDYSIGLLLKFGNFSFYLGGDLTSDIEDTLKFRDDLLSGVEDKLADHVCAFKCGHHGSKHSTSVGFLKKLSPSAGFISAANHSYCHPDDETIKRLCGAESVKKVYLTNCVYNRAGVNSTFEVTENSLKENIRVKIQIWLNQNEKLIKKKPEGFDEILALKKPKTVVVDKVDFEKLLTVKKLEIKEGKIREHLPGDKDKGDRKRWNDLASYYYTAYDIHNQLEDRKKRTAKGIVAASETHLGNIHLIVGGADAAKNHKFNVYFSNGTKIKMIAHDCEAEKVEAGESDRDYVKTVDRHKSYKFKSSFSLITGPSGEERKNLTPDDVDALAEKIDDLWESIWEHESDTQYLDAVESVLGGKPRTDYENTEINDFIDDFIIDYEEALELYHTVQHDKGKLYKLKHPTEEAYKALKEAR